MTEYSIEKLYEAFLDHSLKSGISNQHQKQMWIEMNPGEPVPDHFNDDFSLPEALAVMCAEIIRIRDGQYKRDDMEKHLPK